MKVTRSKWCESADTDGQCQGFVGSSWRHAARVRGARSGATKKETALHVSVGKEETGPVPGRRRAAVPELDPVKTNSDTRQPLSEGLQKG